MPKFKVILTDLDGVLRTYPPRHSAEIEAELGLKNGDLLRIAFQRKFLEPAITGKITDEEWRRLIVEDLAGRFERSTVTAAITRWSTFPGTLAEDIHKLYIAKKKECKIALLTNATSRLNTDLQILGILDLFDIIYNSAEIGIAKPDPRLFNHVLGTINHSASEILFVDDSRENIHAAKSLGFHVHLFESRQSLQKVLA